MNISYNWLKEYVNFDLTPEETAATYFHRFGNRKRGRSSIY